jgi:prepilin-type N-terminal cleavage/methylation domain-containing protein/prepilin-type processing-associated H-X9-DG protein
MKTHLIKGFTLVELLVVIAIIGMLSAALIVFVPGMVETGRSVKCKTNLKNLAQAASGMPTAGSFEFVTVDMDENKQGLWYHSTGAWVSWTPNGQWPYSSKDVSQRDSMTASTFFEKNRSDANSKAYFSITNGVLWSAVGKDASIYLCETHKKVVEPVISARIYRSYVMNRYFGYDDRNDPATYRRWLYVDDVAKSGTASILLMFAELPGQLGQSIDTSSGKEDSVLDPMNNEAMGFNHKIGKKWIANVAFADGHVEGLVQPLGANTTDLKDLTEHLCNGEEIDATIRAKMQ